MQKVIIGERRGWDKLIYCDLLPLIISYRLLVRGLV